MPQIAYHEVAGQLRELIVRGTLKTGERLPSESELGEQFGVSRSTIREALRMLSSQRVISTKRGVGGGTVVAALTHADVSEMLEGNLAMLAQSQGCTVGELLEARQYVEVPAARLAALRRTDEQVARMRESIPGALGRVNGSHIFELNHRFHEIVLEATGNRLLHILTQPLFTVLQTRFLRDRATPAFWKMVMGQHATITDSIERGDGDGAAKRMEEHLESLRSTYEAIDAGQAEEGG